MNSDAKDLLVKLINCKSVTPNDDGALSVIENALNANNFKCERLIFGSGDEKVQNLFARLGNKSPHICFAGHSDVVPEGDIKHWEFSPFDGEISDGKIFGRGAVDMPFFLLFDQWQKSLNAIDWTPEIHINNPLPVF